MKDILKFLKYLPVLFILLISIIIFRALFKRYGKKHVEKFEEEEVNELSLVNEIRTLIMNNETEYQNNMNQVLEKISSLETKLSAQSLPPTQVVPPTQVAPPQVVPPQVVLPQMQPTQSPPTQVAPPQVVPPQVAPPQVTPDSILVDDEDSDDESNVSVSEAGEQTTEPFIDGISCSATANCASLF